MVAIFSKTSPAGADNIAMSSGSPTRNSELPLQGTVLEFGYIDYTKAMRHVFAYDTSKPADGFKKLREETDEQAAFFNARCTRYNFQKLDAKLNDLYQQLWTELPAQRFEELRQAQRAWITYKETSCKQQTALHGQSVEILCLANITRSRVIELDRELRTLRANRR